MKRTRRGSTKRPVLYVVHVVTEDPLFGNADEYVIRAIRKPILGVPYAAKAVRSFEEGAGFCRERGCHPVFLAEFRWRRPDGVFEYGEPVEVQAPR